jgi:hypothetical protein
MSAMVATFRNKYYFCGVKSLERYEAAAYKQRFLYPYISVYSSRKECGTSNGHKVSAREYLTAPIAAFIMSNLN